MAYDGWLCMCDQARLCDDVPIDCKWAITMLIVIERKWGHLSPAIMNVGHETDKQVVWFEYDTFQIAWYK